MPLEHGCFLKLNAHRIILAVILIVGLAVLWFAYDANRAMRNSYAVWWAADMVTEHLKANNNEWPVNWDDLRDDYETCVERSGQPWTFDEIRQRVTIDFKVTTDELLENVRGLTEPNFSVIRLSDGTDSHWQDREPNVIIYKYLTETTEPPPLHTGFGVNAG